MIAAAFDDRLMGAPVVTGGGGIGAYRLAGDDHRETLDIMQKKYPNWSSPHLHTSSGGSGRSCRLMNIGSWRCARRDRLLRWKVMRIRSLLPTAVKASFDEGMEGVCLPGE